MNDFWNDPPDEDYPDILCAMCGSDMLTMQVGATAMRVTCDDCGHSWVEPIEQEQDPLDFENAADIDVDCLVQEQATCPHDKPWTECNACMVAGDLAYDAAREGGR